MQSLYVLLIYSYIFFILFVSADRKGVSGNAKEGCNAIIVTKSDWSKREIDTFHDVTYHTDSSMQGSLALERSFHTQKEIRLFRSTKNKSSKFAPTLSKSSPVACYRYDGLYLVAQFTTMDATSGQLFLLKRKSASAVENGLPRQQSMSSEVLSELTTRLKLVQSYIAHNSFWPHHSSVHSSLDKNKKDSPLSALKCNLSNTISSDSCVGETKATMRQSFIPDRPVQQSSLQIQKSSTSSASRNNQTNKSIAEIIPKSIPYQQTLLSESQSCLSAKASAEQVDIKEEQRLRAEYEKATLVKRRGKQRKKRRPKHRREFFNGSIILIREKSAFQREWIDTRRLRL